MLNPSEHAAAKEDLTDKQLIASATVKQDIVEYHPEGMEKKRKAKDGK